MSLHFELPLHSVAIHHEDLLCYKPCPTHSIGKLCPVKDAIKRFFIDSFLQMQYVVCCMAVKRTIICSTTPEQTAIACMDQQ